MRYTILSLIFILMVMGFASAASDLGVFRSGDCVRLIQVCDNCTYNNITSISYPNSSNALTTQVVMTSFNSEFNYTFCKTQSTGTYTVNGFGNEGGTKSAWSYNFVISPIGRTFTTPQSIMYVLLVGFVFLIFILSIYTALSIPNKEVRNEDGRIIQLNWNKYWKWGTFAIGYVCGLALLYFAWNISYAFLEFSALSNFFQAGFKVLGYSAIPVFVIGFIYFAANWLSDLKKHEKLLGGLTLRG